MTESGKSQFRKLKMRRFLVGIFFILLLTGICIQLFLSFYLDSYLGDRLKSAVNEQTSGNYELQFDDLNLYLWGRRLYIENLAFSPTVPENDSVSSIKIRINSVELDGIGFLSFLMNRKISIDELLLDQPVIEYSEGKSKLQLVSGSSAGSKANFSNLEVDHFQIQNGDLNFSRKPDRTVRAGIRRLDFNLWDVRSDSSTLTKFPFINYDTIRAATDSIFYRLNNNLYILSASAVRISSDEQICSIDSLSLNPPLPKYEFSKKMGKEIDRVDLLIQKIALKDFNFNDLITDQKLAASELQFNGVDLKVFHDKRMPAGVVKEPEFPHIRFKNLPFPVSIDSVKITDTNIQYSEHETKVPMPGTVTFENIDATIYDLTNDSTTIKNGLVIDAFVRSDVMGVGNFNVHFSFPMQEKGYHTISGALGTMPIPSLNRVLNPLAFVNAEDGTINHMKFSMQLDRKKATGTMTMNYEDLKISLMEREDVAEGDTKEVETFITNTFVIQKNNTEPPLREAKIEQEHNPKRSIFTYWWKSLLSGLKNSVGL